MKVEAPPWLKDIDQKEKLLEERFDYHKGNPDVSFDQYRREKRRQLGCWLKARKLIYLDLKYWIYLRDVALGHAQKPIHNDIFTSLLSLAKAGKVVCPFSYAIFDEILKQGDATKRKASAKLVDALSYGASIQQPFEVLNSELLVFFRSKTSNNPKTYPLRESVWTMIYYFMGERYPVWPPTVPADQQAVMQKALDDFHSSFTLEEQLDSLEPEDLEQMRQRNNLAGMLNANKSQYSSVKVDLKTAYAAELVSSLEGYHDQIVDLIGYLWEGRFRPNGAPKFPACANEIASHVRLIIQAHVNGTLKHELPSIHIPCAIHAAVRCNKAQKLEENDLNDFAHAQTALPYFDIFLTERTLANFLSSPSLKFDALYGTKILWQETDVLDLLRGL